MSLLHRQRACRLVALCMLLATAAACTESDELLVDQVGVTRLLLVDPALRNQSLLFSPENDIQVAEWKIASAALDIDGAPVPLVTNRDCIFSDTSQFSPVAEGDCATGIVIEASTTAFQVRLTLSIEAMELRRGRPYDLSSEEDSDGDGVANDGDRSGLPYDAPCGQNHPAPLCDDNCPLIANPDQADDNGDGVGNACTTNDSIPARDSDGDGVFDGLDNCVWIANPGQENTMGPLDGLVPDGIGDACPEEVADVLVDGATSFDIIFDPTALDQSFGTTTFVTVDFDSDETLSCDWQTLTCTLDPDKVTVCSHTSITEAVQGC